MPTRRSLLPLAVVWIALTGPVRADDPRPDVAAELKRYYQDLKRPPVWEAALKRLSAAVPKERREAAAYLHALLAQALQDERSGDAPWRATPYWGSSGENPARQLREEIAGRLGGAGSAAEILPVLRWFLDVEPIATCQEQVMAELGTLKGKEATALRVSLAARPHPNAAVTVAALRQLAARKEALPADRLHALCHHHRASVRAAARTLNERLGRPDPGPFDPAKAVRSPAVRKLLDGLTALLVEPPSPRAPFVAVTTTATDGAREEQAVTHGWLLREDRDTAEVFTPFGWKEKFSRKAAPAEGRRAWGTAASTWKRVDLAEAVRRVERIRAAGDKDFELSERGGLTGQFQGKGASLYEALLAQWLYAAGKDTLAARVLLPALDTLYQDDDLLLIVRDRLGQIYGYQMLTAFVGDRDYPRAERMARLLARHFPGTLFHPYAVRLAEELPRRRDDFGKLKLPTPQEWAALRKKLTRREQIDYLCRRVRLLNFFQTGQPFGEPAYSDTQYAEPSGMSRNAAWGGGQGRTEVINPVVELVGPIDGVPAAGKKDYKGLGLTVADLPQLADYLREDWFLLSVSFWRDFAADRHLARARALFALLINEVAKQDLCSAERLDGLTDAGREKEIRRIADWARRNAGKGEADLLLQAVEKEWRPGRMHWSYIKTKIGRLVELREKRLAPVLRRYLDDAGTSDEELEFLLSYARRFDAGGFKKEAERFLDHKSLSVQQQAALLLHATGERQRSHRVLDRVLAKTLIGFAGELQTPEVLHTLLKEGTPEARRIAGRITVNPRLDDLGWERARLLAILAKAGLAEPYRYYLRLLDRAGRELGNAVHTRPVREVIADEIVSEFAPDDPAVKEIAGKYARASDRIPDLKKWLQARRAAKGDGPRTGLHGDLLPAGAVARFGTARLREAAGADCVAFSPDGQLLASINRSRFALAGPPLAAPLLPQLRHPARRQPEPRGRGLARVAQRQEQGHVPVAPG
jgi:hypothetical protein